MMEACQKLQRCTPPRVLAAMLRTWFNGWCTSRRFQRHGTCIFGCSCEDSIEHYAVCKVVAEFARRHLNLHHREATDKLADFILLDVPIKAESESRLVRRSVRTAAVYITFCRHSHGGQGRPTATTLAQIANELVRENWTAARHVAQAWTVSE